MYWNLIWKKSRICPIWGQSDRNSVERWHCSVAVRKLFWFRRSPPDRSGLEEALLIVSVDVATEGIVQGRSLCGAVHSVGVVTLGALESVGAPVWVSQGTGLVDDVCGGIGRLGYSCRNILSVCWDLGPKSVRLILISSKWDKSRTFSD